MMMNCKDVSTLIARGEFTPAPLMRRLAVQLTRSLASVEITDRGGGIDAACSFLTTRSSASLCFPTSWKSTCASESPAAFMRSLWQVTQYLSMTALPSTAFAWAGAAWGAAPAVPTAKERHIPAASSTIGLLFSMVRVPSTFDAAFISGNIAARAPSG